VETLKLLESCRNDLETNVSPLAKAVYHLLRLRASLAEPRITYAELARNLRDVSEQFETLSHRSQELYAALVEVGEICRALGLPPLPALVVRADTKRPGAAYHAAPASEVVSREEWIAAWREDLEAVKRTSYPAP
jgi:hypothetical protein